MAALPINANVHSDSETPLRSELRFLRQDPGGGGTSPDGW
jgi:hypothetical protein